MVHDISTVKIRQKMASSQDNIHTDCNIQNAGICCLQKRFETAYAKRYANYRQCCIYIYM